MPVSHETAYQEFLVQSLCLEFLNKYGPATRADIASLYNLDGHKIYFEMRKLEKWGLVRRRDWPSTSPTGTIMWYSVDYDQKRALEALGDKGDAGG